MSQMNPGTRVVRGPDWQSKRQDGGAGHAGTIVYIPKPGSSDDKVTVIWDSGRELRYRAGNDGKYDLRVLDNAQTGVMQETITCDSCLENPLQGLRWKCACCHDFDLCSTCYMKGSHDLAHGFLRMDTGKTRAVSVAPRSHAKSKPVMGVFKGAKVMRGPHWKWKNDDGGEGGEGVVLEILPWEKNVHRGGVKVKWNDTRKEGTYRIGGEGAVDIIYTEEATLANYYFDHLPLVDIVDPGIIVLKNSDKVRVSLQKDEFKQLQDNKVYGGWSEGMIQCIKELGTIVNILYGGKTCRVQYMDGTVWTVNRQSLWRIHSFAPGDAVKIIEEVNSVKELQEGHGGWNDEMKSTLGSTGRIVRIDDDGDVRVKIGPRVWIFSPVCVSPCENLEDADKVPQLSKSEMEHDKADDLKRMQKEMEQVAGRLADLFVGLLRGIPGDDAGDSSLVEAAAKGDLDKVKEIVKNSPEKVNAKHEHKTALQLACYEGKGDVVKFLLDNKADIHTADNEGDTALHFAAFGQEESVIKQLLDKGAKIDTQNKKGLTCLHITIGKGSVPCTKLLVEKGASVNVKDVDGDSPLHDCIIQKKRQNQLIDKVFNAPKADFSVKNKKNFNVLHWAALKDCRRATEIIIKRSPELKDASMDEGFTTLHICAANNHNEIASAILMAKANVNAVDGNGRTALHIAVTQSHKRMVELLLTHNCNVDIQDREGNTALHVAQISRALPDALARLLGVDVKNDDTGLQISCILIEARGKVDTKNKKGQTPLDLCTDDTTREFLQRLAKQASSKSFAMSQMGVMLPTHWDTMDKTQTLRKVVLDTSNGLLQKEFQEVRNRFCKTLPQAKIIKIERVQNKYLWEHYYLCRRKFEGKYGMGCANERDLFHGTCPEAVETICRENLDHRLAGDRVGVLFGQGTYFATFAKYSDGYAQADANKHKFMFQCRVLAGKITLGDPSFKRPPQIHHSDVSKGLYDCCVDCTDNPRIFCLFDANQYYPEYVIQYQ